MDLRPATFYAYAKTVRVRIVPHLGELRLAQVDTATVEAWYARLLGEGLAPKTIANAGGVLSVAFADAVRLKLLRSNPCRDARLPRRSHREMTAWTEEEARAFLAAIEGERLAPVWRLALLAGLRRGELCGLRWRDVDLAAGTVEVVQTRGVANGVHFGPPKSRAGARVVALDRTTTATLSTLRRTQKAERLALGLGWNDDTLVVVDEAGREPYPDSLTRWWSSTVRKAGVRPIRLHDARHTAATLALRAGVPLKVVTQRLGHADVAVTMRVYQHATAQDDRLAADAVARALGDL